ncbi:hypothetical protein R80B4_02537 [Fibrobacteres bacterium R8-0-B4]
MSWNWPGVRCSPQMLFRARSMAAALADAPAMPPITGMRLSMEILKAPRRPKHSRTRRQALTQILVSSRGTRGSSHSTMSVFTPSSPSGSTLIVSAKATRCLMIPSSW